ncbi:U3 small nucleolar RNA-interacting protein 2 [Sarcoptes scabiei]|uniref:U3 small nucleolar RNA-interacting protein 2 n=1 Tax=Sarcoptes scabiei TaxID=52283 RepID=A0A834QZV0_SARSC|nr:U3 small nucleolar RNA-interacting protein 2 [Sarcoptes scabiei]
MAKIQNKSFASSKSSRMKKKQKHSKFPNKIDSEVSSDDELDYDEINNFSEEKRPIDQNQEEEFDESPQEKKIRLAKEYLAQLETHDSLKNETNDNSLDHSNLISNHLKDILLEKKGKLHRNHADRISTKDDIIIMKNGHRKSITALALSYDGRFVFTASKDCYIVKWDCECGKKLLKVNVYDEFNNDIKSTSINVKKNGPINALALSSDYKFLASGFSLSILIWNPDSLKIIHTFSGHRDAVTGLVFRRSFHQLFSCSKDRMIKVWNLDEMNYSESLLGHHDCITAIDAYVNEKCLTSGGRDGTIRLWKIPEESNLIYLADKISTIDCVKMINDNHFISASDDGSISLWSTNKKKPLTTVFNAHGDGFWITSLACIKNSDLFASGSYNGEIIFWKIHACYKKIEKKMVYQIEGFVNGMEFDQECRFLVAAISQEHRLGRWFDRNIKAKNVVHIIPILLNDDQKSI